MKDINDVTTEELDLSSQDEIQGVVKFISKMRYSKLSKVDLIVFQHVLMVCSDFGRKATFDVNQTEVADQLRMHQPVVS
ncbi:hypothetical protein [Parashewanella curva]|uniref:hypothetical protein n=1 Tax=Parashewanella curva TaxID=2338552 RepID=UPI00105A740B|nr:hypothetical protein [Parashewanella curva]